MSKRTMEGATMKSTTTQRRDVKEEEGSDCDESSENGEWGDKGVDYGQ